MKRQEFINQSVESVVFDKNSAVLMYETVSSTGNRKITSVSFDGVTDTKPETLVSTVLKYFFAEYLHRADFNEQYGTFVTGTITKDTSGKETKETVKTFIEAKKIFSQFLNKCNIIYKTDSTGKLSKAIVCDDGVFLKDTALNIKEKQLLAVTDLNSKKLRAVINHTAKAIVEQCSYISDIEALHNTIEETIKKETEEEKKKKEEELRNKKEEQKEDLKKVS